MVKEKEEKKKITQKEYEKKVQELAKEGLTSEKIGQKLRQISLEVILFTALELN